MNPRFASTLLFLLIIVAGALGADLSGTYEANSEGEKYSLVLHQEGDKLTGEAKGEGQVYKLKGTVAGDKATGTVSIDGIPVTLQFRAEKTGSKLKLVVAAPGENGKADWDDADEYAFTLVSGGVPEKKDGVLKTFSKQSIWNSEKREGICTRLRRQIPIPG